MGTRDLVARFRTYAHCVTSHEWFRDGEVLPLLLIIAPGSDQEMRIARIVEAVLADAPGVVIRTMTATRLADQGPLAAIWYQMPTYNKRAEMEPRSRFYHTLHER